MAKRQVNGRYYVYFTWKKHRIETVTAAKSMAEAKRIEKDVKSAFRVYRFDNLDTAALEFVVKTFENKGWALPLELHRSEPRQEMTLIDIVKEFLKADQKHRAERNIYCVDRLVEHFGEAFPLKEIKVARIKEYQRTRQQKVANGTVNRELAVLSSILRVQVEHENIDFNPCLLVKRLPANQRDSYLSREDFDNLLDHSGWIRDLLVMLYYTGMRFNEVVNLRWEMYKPDRRMLILPSDMTKEGKNPNKTKLRPKRVPLRKEVVDLLERLRTADGKNVVKAVGLVLGYCGKFTDRDGMYEGKPIDRFMIRKCWARAIRLAGISGLQLRDFRHTWKTNAQRSGMDPAVRNLILGHSGQRSVEDRYIRVSDQELLKSVDAMSFDHGWTELDLVEES